MKINIKTSLIIRDISHPHRRFVSWQVSKKPVQFWDLIEFKRIIFRLHVKYYNASRAYM